LGVVALLKDIGESLELKPQKRTRLRVMLGMSYYTLKRYIEWYLDRKKYSKKIVHEKYQHVYFEHRTPLLRRLRDVDMWLQYNKITNLKIASKNINNVVVQPGETFSYWRLIGRTTKRKGYVDGMILYYGGFKSGIGGGLCQLSNLIYWMTLHTPLTIIERYRHSYDVFPDSNRTQPFGSGATCFYNYRDLQIYNGTNQTFQLCIDFDQDYLIGEWRTLNPPNFKYEVYEKEHQIRHEFWGGYTRHNLIHRKVYSSDETFIRDEYVTENHAIMMYEPLLSEGGR
jgi:vancomycin resistance protein VanW